jgi:hypothetical protein
LPALVTVRRSAEGCSGCDVSNLMSSNKIPSICRKLVSRCGSAWGSNYLDQHRRVPGCAASQTSGSSVAAGDEDIAKRKIVVRESKTVGWRDCGGLRIGWSCGCKIAGVLSIAATCPLADSRSACPVGFWLRSKVCGIVEAEFPFQQQRRTHLSSRCSLSCVLSSSVSKSVVLLRFLVSFDFRNDHASHDEAHLDQPLQRPPP